jgi:4-hydroxybutyryl-CoA dehydratase/vinylacetyl-CoA-Delta-isomerase
MALRKPEQYVESLRDGREVYMKGKRIEDVTKEPALWPGITHIATEYRVYDMPEYRDLFVTYSDELKEDICRLWKIPRCADDLLKRSDAIAAVTMLNHGHLTVKKGIATDALNALTIAASEMRQHDSKSPYLERVLEFRRYLMKNDLVLCGCVTDVKGNRVLRPSEQEHPDYYVHIVERQKDGIIVKGAKAHISGAAYVNELVVVPTRFMPESDKDYAVGFAVPCNAKGLKFINRPESVHNPDDFPVSGRHLVSESIVIFDNVFIPWERVFLCGEWQASALSAQWFGNWHRFSALSYKRAEADVLLGAGLLAAEYNGIEKVSHIREDLFQLYNYAQVDYAFAKVAAHECQIVHGIACPNVVYTNLGKFYFATNYAKFIDHLLDICGGLVATAPSIADFRNPATAEYLNHYLGAAKGVSAEDRVRLFKLICDVAASGMGGWWPVTVIHGEGSMAAERLMAVRQIDAEHYKTLAKKAANIIKE